MLDYFALEETLGEEERLIRDTVREFVDEDVRPDIAEYYQAGEFPTELIPSMGELGVFGANLDAPGLPNVSETAYGLVMQELEAGDSGLRSMASVQGSLVLYPIVEYGSADQIDSYVQPLATGEQVGCFGLTEPAHGSNPAGMETHAERDGDGYVLNGSKTWITNAPIADLAIIWGRDRSTADTPVRGFLVETDRDGFSVTKIDGKLSMRASSTGEIGLNDVWVPESAVLPGIEGMKGPLSCLTQARAGIAWGMVGAARDCFEEARSYALEREQFGGPIAQFQLQQSKLADMAAGITTNQLLAHRLAKLKESGKLEHQQVSLAKRETVRTARDVARLAREMIGGNGITSDYSPMRHLANIETVYTYEGTDDIHTLVMGEELTGIPAYT